MALKKFRLWFRSLVQFPVYDADFAIANVQCQYDGPSDEEGSPPPPPPPGVHDHTYDTRDEPPAYIIHHVTDGSVLDMCADYNFVGGGALAKMTRRRRGAGGSHVQVTQTLGPARLDAKIMTLGPGPAAGLNVIHVGDRAPGPHPQSAEYNINKRIRRSEVLLRQAADAVSRGSTFQTVSDQFNIPISTIRFFMARKGILPRRRRGRNTQPRPCGSPEPPFHMQHYKLPDMVALRADDMDDPLHSTL